MNKAPLLLLFFTVCCAWAQTGKPAATAAPTFGQLFTGSPYGQDGEAGCQGTYNGNWQSYFTTTANSISVAAGNDCRTVNTHTNNSCVFNVGTGGVTQVNFDFAVSDGCHASQPADWLAFWIYSEPWNSLVEVDFIESTFGPGTGLNSNFAGNGNQVVILPGGAAPPSWNGSVNAKFSGTGGAVNVSVSNSVNSTVATSTLTRSTGYFFVMDTTPTTASGCSITVSNLRVAGAVPAGQCVGLNITPSSATK
jgi:hypothetical protein